MTITVSHPPPVARCGNTRVALDTNDDFGFGLPDVDSAVVVLYWRKVGFGAAAIGLNQLPCCADATAVKANKRAIDKVAALISPGAWPESRGLSAGLAAVAAFPDVL